MRRTIISRRVDVAASEVEREIGLRLAESYAELVELTPVAIDALAYIAQYGRHEEARVSAAKEILDRAELTPEVRITVSSGQVDERTTRVEELRKQLGGMKGNLSNVIDLRPEQVGEEGEETG